MLLSGAFAGMYEFRFVFIIMVVGSIVIYREIPILKLSSSVASHYCILFLGAIVDR